MPLDWNAYAQHLTNGSTARRRPQEQRSEVIMANLNGFNANNVDPATDFEPIPAGKYLAVITELGDEADQERERHTTWS